MQTVERTKSQVTITSSKGGAQIKYHTNRRDALHQMLLGVSVLSTDRCGKPARLVGNPVLKVVNVVAHLAGCCALLLNILKRGTLLLI